MHQEIKRFWEQIGLVDCTLSAPISYYMVETKNGWVTIAEVWTGGIKDGPDQPTKYFYNNVQYDEAEMLRLIKQKAFL
jgi:hypothetical protein